MMNKITVMICAGIAIASCAAAQTNTADTGKKAATPPPRFQRVMTPEQKAAADAQAKAQEADHQNMMDQLHITSLRPGKSGTAGQPNYANYDEAKANPFPNLPDPLVERNGKKVTTAKEWWNKRRPEIVEDFDREVYGRVPKNTPKVTWSVTSLTNEMVGDIPVITKKLVGHVDNSSYPAIDVNIELTLVTPANATGPVPVIMVLGGGGFGPPRPAPITGASATVPTRPAGPTRPPGAREQLIQKGWGYASLNTSSVQADNGAGLTKGIIGLCNKGQYRKPDDWGALRAWAWGASRAMDYFETDKVVNAKEVGVEGHSRWGKGAIVTMAYDQRFAIGYISSSGEGGIKLHRRDAGEVVENLTAGGEYHWMAGNFLKYGGPLNWGNLPVDAHELAALCAPRPIFVSAGSAGDGWQDAQGMFMGAAGASPVYELLGKKGLGTNTMPKAEVLLDGDIAFRRHLEGHTDAPNWPFFITYASKYFK
jgi:hypothetical protein